MKLRVVSVDLLIKTSPLDVQRPVGAMCGPFTTPDFPLHNRQNSFFSFSIPNSTQATSKIGKDVKGAIYFKNKKWKKSNLKNTR